MRLLIKYLSLLALAALFVNSSSAFELGGRQRTSVDGNFSTTSVSAGSGMTTSDTGSSTASRMIMTAGTSVPSATTTLHGPTAAGSTSASASATSSSGQKRTIGFSASQFAWGVGAVACFIAFNML